MHELIGIGIAPGLASGTAVISGAETERPAARYRIAQGDVHGEHKRLDAAVAKSVRDLERVRRKVQRKVGQDEAGIFGFHAALLHDRNFINGVKERIHKDLVNTETALLDEMERIREFFAQLDAPYLRERGADINDIGLRILRNLSVEEEERLSAPGCDSILVTDELFPSDAARFNRNNLAAIVSEHGSENSHAAILARSMGIPFVTGVPEVTKKISDGMPLLVDGTSGVVVMLPTDRQSAVFEKRKARYVQEMLEAETEEGLPCVTSDGTEISLWANIRGVDEAGDALKHNLQGIGLLRSEYLFLDMDEPPTAETQQEAYAGMAESIRGLPLTIRTMDLGGDKLPRFLSLPKGTNPDLGIRGLRFSLFQKDLFDEQVKAMLNVSERFPIRILLPMVIDANDFILAKRRILDLADQSGIAAVPEVGAMIETPSAVFQADAIAAEADFLSIGTNDLAQFTLAADRHSAAMADGYFALHPAILRAVRSVVDAAAAHGCEVCPCGEAAGDGPSACLLVGLGIRTFSMSPFRSSRVRFAIRRSDSRKLREVADEACRAGGAEEVRRLLRTL